jgi:anti-sigma28 factor (negative regulator of flagellin synthesis)
MFFQKIPKYLIKKGALQEVLMSMKINRGGIDKSSSESILRGLTRIKQSEKEPAHIAADDKDELSTPTLDLKVLQHKVMPVLEVRPEKVEQIKLQVETRIYRISPGKIAERLMAEAMEI